VALHFARQTRQHLITQFCTGQMLFRMPNQQCQSTEVNSALLNKTDTIHSNNKLPIKWTTPSHKTLPIDRNLQCHLKTHILTWTICESMGSAHLATFSWHFTSHKILNNYQSCIRKSMFNIHRWVEEPSDHHGYSDTSSSFQHVHVPPPSTSWRTCGTPSVRHHRVQSTRPVSRRTHG